MALAEFEAVAVVGEARHLCVHDRPRRSHAVDAAARWREREWHWSRTWPYGLIARYASDFCSPARSTSFNSAQPAAFAVIAAPMELLLKGE